MLVMARDRDYPDLLGILKGKRVAIWTCNTCARLCNGIGGTDSCGRLAERLAEDGVEITGVYATSASCLESKVKDKAGDILSKDPDIILSITCSVGSECASRIFSRECVNPRETFGYGYLTSEGMPVLSSRDGDIQVTELSSRCSSYI